MQKKSAIGLATVLTALVASILIFGVYSAYAEYSITAEGA